jgi:Tfp pilus assembly protein PilV
MNLAFCHRAPGVRHRREKSAFTLIEVMISIAIFFMAMFTILGLLSAGLHAASILRTSGPTAGMVAAQLSLTNKMEEGSDSGNFGEIYQGYRWVAQTREVASNGLFQVDITVYDTGGNPQSSLSALFYRPDSPKMGLQN